MCEERSVFPTRILFFTNVEKHALTRVTEIYRIVSSKALDQGEGSQNVLAAGQKIDLQPSANAEEKKGGCC